MRLSPYTFSNLPHITRYLIGLSFVGYVLELGFRNKLNFFFGLVPQKITQNLWLWQLVTYIFIHGNFLHFLFNAFMLWMFGPIVESDFGPRRFLRYFLITGIGAGIFTVLFSYNSPVPVIGASGAIYGLLIAFAILHPHQIVRFYFLFPMTSRQMVIFLVIIEFVLSFSGPNSGISNISHLGGIVIGYLYLKSAVIFKSFYVGQGFSLAKKGFSLAKKSFSLARNVKEKTVSVDNEIQEQVDEILEKISKKGMNSLTWKERRILEHYSKKAKTSE